MKSRCSAPPSAPAANTVNSGARPRSPAAFTVKKRGLCVRYPSAGITGMTLCAVFQSARPGCPASRRRTLRCKPVFPPRRAGRLRGRLLTDAERAGPPHMDPPFLALSPMLYSGECFVSIFFFIRPRTEKQSKMVHTDKRKEPRDMTAFSHNAAQPAAQFAACRRTLPALGDESRRRLILEMMQMKDCTDAWAGAIAEKAHLSRPRSISSAARMEGCRHHPRAAGGNKKLLFFSFWLRRNRSSAANAAAGKGNDEAAAPAGSGRIRD